MKSGNIEKGNNERISLIRWQRKDYARLSRAIRDFNKRVKEIEKNNLILPDLLKYKDIKSEISTRKQLNQILSSLKRIKYKSAFDEIKLQSGEIITKWENYEIQRKQKRAIDYINKELKNEVENQTFKGLKNEKIEKLESTLKTLENYNKKTGKQLKYSLDRIKKLGSIDYKLNKAKTFRENFMYALKEGSSTFKNYNILKEKLESIKNPYDFYEYVKQSEILLDIFVWYDDESGTLIYGGFKGNEEAFNHGLEELGIFIDTFS